MPGTLPTDLHQHLLPEALIAALARRSEAPRLARDGRGWRLELAGEPASGFDPADHDPGARSAIAERDGVRRVVVSLSSALGIEALPGEVEPERVARLLDRLEARNAPLFVHPGPVAGAAGAPAWWPALTGYVAQMSAAWHAFAAWGRARHPRVRVVFAMLA